MAYGDDSDGRTRMGALAASVGVTALLGVALASLTDLRLTTVVEDGLTVFSLDRPAPPPPPPPPSPPATPTPAPRAAEAEGAAAPPNRRRDPTPVTAPKTPRPLPTTNKQPATERPGTGAGTERGAGTAPGPGTGAGGSGDGTGAGRFGSGPGGGGDGGTGGGLSAKARKIAGTIANKDRSKAIRQERAQGTVRVVYTVTPAGRATNCAVLRSSGFPSLDQLTCRLIEERFRYEPARDGGGRAIAVDTGWEQRWWYEGGD